MTILPIVARELRVMARRKSVYGSRLVFVLAALGVATVILGASRGRVSSSVSQSIFTLLSALVFLYCLFAGVWITSDSLSEERREGTLGLLFLTDLQGYDVALGKLVATSLRAVYGMVAVFPVIAIPLLFGGVAASEVARMVLVFTTALFLSLTTGVWISSVNLSALRAATRTFLVLLFLTLAGPVLALVWYPSAGDTNTAVLLLTSLSPALGFELASATGYGRFTEFFWISLAISNLFAWIFLLLASLAVRRAWTDHRASGWITRVRGWLRMEAWPWFQQPREKQRRQRRAQPADALDWLANRQRAYPQFFWLVFGITAFFWLWGGCVTRVLFSMSRIIC